MKKKLLLLSARQFEIPFVLTAQKMGYYVITTGNNSAHPAHNYADEYIPCDNTDFDGIVDLVKRERIDALCQGCTDRCAILASYVGQKLGIAGHDSVETSRIIHHKDKFKEFVNKYNIMSPKTIWFEKEEQAISNGIDMDWPVIIKPVDLGGGQGISVANNWDEYRNAVRLAFSKSIVGHIVVEPFIHGTLHSMSTFLVDQKVVAFGTANDYSFHNLYMTNTGTFPADNWKSVSKILIPEVEKIAKILKLVDGLMHFQYILDVEGKPWIIEMMRRSPGNNFLYALSNSVGVDWVEWIIRAEAGEDVRLIPKAHEPDRYYGYHSVMASKNGVFRDLFIDEDIRKYVYQVEQFFESGYRITDYMNEKFGSIQFFFPNRQLHDKYIPLINKMVYARVD